MVTKSTLAVTTRRSIFGQLGLLLLMGVALGVLGMYMLQTFPGRTVATKSTSRDTSGAIQTSSGQDVLSVECLEQQHAVSATVLTGVMSQNDVLSVEWIEQQRQSNPNKANVGSRAARPLPDNYIGFIE